MSRAIILAHYDPDRIVDPYVVRALAAYRAVADRLVMVSTSAPSLSPEAAALVDEFLPRDNVGYDFGSWRAGLALLGPLDRFDEVVCVNDSAYGPFSDLATVLADPRIAAADVWGLIRSAQRGDHLQSWFLAFRRPVLASPAFTRFWEGVVPQPSKEGVIDHYEVGVSASLAAAGFQMAALYDGRHDGPPSFRERCRNVSPFSFGPFGRHRRRVGRMGPPYNPSELFWERACDAGVPYLKAAIFRANPYRVDVRRVLARAALRWPDWAPLIHTHLSRVGMNAPPDRTP